MVHSYTQLSQLWLPSLSWFSPLHSRLPAFHISSPPPLLLQDAALKLKLESVDVSTTPPLTPASIPPSPAVTTSEEPGKNSSSFFADTYYDDGGSTSSNISISTSSSMGASSSEDEAASVRVQQRVRPSLVTLFAFCLGVVLAGAALPW